MRTPDSLAESLREAFTNPDSTYRLNLAMNVGTFPNDSYIHVLVDQFEVEPDFYVRDTLTWALLNHNRDKVLKRILFDVNSPYPQMRAQCLHTLSKIADPHTWSAITHEHLTDPNDSIATTAWRAAAILVPDEDTAELIDVLCTQLGRGDTRTQLSLSKALLNLGEPALDALKAFHAVENVDVREHVASIFRLAKDHEAEYLNAIEAAKRKASLDDAPAIDPAII